MKRLPALAGALIFLFPATGAGAQTYQPNAVEQRLVNQIVFHRLKTWQFQDRMHHRRLSTEHRERRADVALLSRLKRYWEHRHYLAWRNWKRSQRSAPTPQSAGHWALWNCIHNGAYPGAPHEGDSASGTYTGYLQMTNPWMGHSGNWHGMGTGVYAIAEQEYVRSGYSTAWLTGQWPNTAPPCIGFA